MGQIKETIIMGQFCLSVNNGIVSKNSLKSQPYASYVLGDHHAAVIVLPFFNIIITRWQLQSSMHEVDVIFIYPIHFLFSTISKSLT